MPYGHPRNEHRIVFAADEPSPIKRLADGLVADDRPSPLDQRRLALTDALFADDALVWGAIRSRSVKYGAATGPLLEIDFPDTPQLGIWSKPGASFVCIEPWHGHADPQGYAGDVRDKPGILAVAPGEEKRIGMSVTLAS